VIQITPSAVTEIKKLLAEQNQPNMGLRVAVFSGGCSGMSYRLVFDEKQEHDQIQDFDGLKVFIDEQSNTLLEGTSIDFVDSAEERGFKFSNPNIPKEPDCGGCRGCH